MRILHTSDWHLGRQFHGLSLEEDHDHVLAQILLSTAEQKSAMRRRKTRPRCYMPGGGA